jgi:hypothetical protein
MFISRFTQEQHRELNTLRERCAQLGAQLASSRTSQEWLEARVTSLEYERSALTDRLLQVSYPVPTIARTNERPAGRVESYGQPLTDTDYAVPAHLKDALNKMPHPRMADPAPRPRAEDMGDTISAHQVQDAFEDMGDEAAAEAGIVHDDAGAVRHTR